MRKRTYLISRAGLNPLPHMIFQPHRATNQGGDPGRCYLRAGFKKCGMTKGGLVALQLLPEDMPKPARPMDDNR